MRPPNHGRGLRSAPLVIGTADPLGPWAQWIPADFGWGDRHDTILGLRILCPSLPRRKATKARAAASCGARLRMVMV